MTRGSAEYTVDVDCRIVCGFKPRLPLFTGTASPLVATTFSAAQSKSPPTSLLISEDMSPLFHFSILFSSASVYVNLFCFFLFICSL